MNKAKQAAADFLSKDGKHRTTIDEDYRKPVTEEHVHPHRHEEILTAVDRDVHQDHHHTTVQPVKVKETLPEQHTHNVAPVEHKSFEHGNERELRATLEADMAKYKDTTTTHEKTHTSSAAPALQGEHVHHHVHEHIQPVIMKKTHAPETVHTTVPIHETHHMAPTHHETTTLPAKTLEEFTATGGRGTLKGRETETLFEHEGAPTKMGENFSYGENMLQEGSNGSGMTGGTTGGARGLTGAMAAGGAAAGGATAGASGRNNKNMTTSVSQARSGGLGEEVATTQRRSDDLISDDTKHYGVGYGENVSGGLGSSTGTQGSRQGRNTLGSEVESQMRGENLGSAGTTGTGTGSGRLTSVRTDELINAETNKFGKHHKTSGTTGTTGTASTVGGLGAGAGALGATGASAVPRSEVGRNATGSDLQNRESTGSKGSHKSSMLDRLNPLKDADGDGKKGFLS